MASRPQENSLTPQTTSALVTVQILFGINYVTSKVIVAIIPPLIWASFRAIVSGIALLCIALFSGRPHPPWKKAFFLPLLFYSLLGVVINQGCFLIGLHYTTATNSSIITTLIPFFTLLFVTLFGKERLTLNRAVGFLFALVGVLVLRGAEHISLSDQTLIGDILTALNCISYGLFLALSKKFIETYDALWSTTWLFLSGSLILTLASLPGWFHFQWPPLNPTILGSMCFAIFGGTLAAYFLNVWALGHTRSSSVALFIYLQPPIASTLAWIYFGEAMTYRTLGAMLLIFTGMLIALSRSFEGSSAKKSR